jgi:hypothetical protein
MARSRSLRPGFFKNDLLVQLPFEARLLFAGLWTLADKEGRLEDRPLKIKMELFPGDDINTNDLLAQLADKKFITRYQVEGESYIQVNKFLEHQRPHPKEPNSVIPKPRITTASNGETRQGREKVGRAVREGREDKEGLEGKAVALGEGCGEGEVMPSWMNEFYELFADGWAEKYPGQDYADIRKQADFIHLASLQNNKAFTLPNWGIACQNYLATPQKFHTLADLATNFSAFLNHSIDRYNRPVNSRRTEKENRTINAANQVLQRIQNDATRTGERH